MVDHKSALRAFLQQPHQHPALVVLATKEHGQHLDVSLLSAWTKPIHGTIESQVAKARKEIVMAFSAEGSGGQPFGRSDDRLDAHLCVALGLRQWFSKAAVGLCEVLGDQHQIVDGFCSEDHRPRSFTHWDCAANLARS